MDDLEAQLAALHGDAGEDEECTATGDNAPLARKASVGHDDGQKESQRKAQVSAVVDAGAIFGDESPEKPKKKPPK